MTFKQDRSCCPSKPALAGHQTLPVELVEKMEAAFQVLSSATRIRILHALSRNEDLSVGKIAKRLGMKIAGISNQLRLMSAMGVVGSRQEGNEVYYSMVDPCVAELLEKGACLSLDSERRVSKR